MRLLLSIAIQLSAIKLALTLMGFSIGFKPILGGYIIYIVAISLFSSMFNVYNKERILNEDRYRDTEEN